MFDQLKYPIGKFVQPHEMSDEVYNDSVLTLAKFPAALQETIGFLPDGALDSSYRDGGWTGRQVVNHLADSHMHCLIRCKWSLTEDSPTIKPYKENLWSELPDSKHFPIGASLQILQGVHARLAHLLAHISREERERIYFHPEGDRTFTLAQVAALYAWHCKHHMGHLLLLMPKAN